MKVDSGIIRVGIAGLGRSGWSIHAAALATLPEQYRVVAVCDPIRERQAEAQARFGCRTYSRFSDLLADGEVEDHVKVVLHAPGQPTIDLEVTSACAYHQDRWLVMGTLGGLTGTPTKLRWEYVDPAPLPPRPVATEPTPDRAYNSEELPWVEENCDLPADGSRLANAQVYRELYPALREGAPLPITAESVRRQIAVLDRCRELSPI